MEADGTTKNAAPHREDDLDLQGQKMEALGLLAGGMAHDMNNILAAIAVVASAMEAEMPRDHPYWDDVQDILSACNRGSKLTKSLLGFARKQRMNQEPISLNDAVTEVQGILSRTVSREIEIVCDLDERLCKVIGDADQLSTVILNICLNGIDAMEGSGTLTIHTCNTSVVHPGPGAPNGRLVHVSISDTGPGIPRGIVDRVFEPFFTTKPKGKGTGLGLSTAYGVVSRHSGEIEVTSTGPEGTTISIYLPAIASDCAAIEKTGGSRPVLGHHRGRILLVDDEDLFRASARRILEKLGYSVIMARNGKEALEIHADRAGEINLVILDMAMPVMAGKETFELLKARSPSLPILLTSGYTDEESVRELLESGAIGFVSKPFDLESLTRALTVSDER